MARTRKLKRKKRFRVNVNRKRLRNKLQKLPSIECKEIKEAWELQKSVRNNLDEMGLSYDSNETFKILNLKQKPIENVKHRIKFVKNHLEIEEDEEKTYKGPKDPPIKVHIVQKLESEASARRERMFRLPNNEIHFITYLMDKYRDDYKMMARDQKNYYQLTWRQIRAKINTFKSIPKQYAEYLVKKGEIVLDNIIPSEKTSKNI